MSEEQTVDNLIGSLRKVQEEKIEEVEEHLRKELGQAEEEYQTELEEIDKNLMDQFDNLMSNHGEELNENVDHFQQLLMELKGAAYHWDDEFWYNFSPGKVSEVAVCHRLGTLKISGHFNQLETLALVPIINGQNAIFLSSVKIKKQITQAFQSLILRLIVTSPKGKIHLVTIEQLSPDGNILGIFPNQHKKQQSIEDNLNKLSQHISQVRKEYLTEKYPTLVEVVAEMGCSPVPHYILAVSDFPNSFSEEAVRQLITIMRKGPACGVHTIMMVDTEELPNLNLEGLDKEANVISYEEDRFIFRNGIAQSEPSDELDFDYSGFDLELDQLPAPDLLEKLITETDVSVFDHANLPS
ncbi:MAG: hypothetical protein CBC13_08475 [Planctomycetia bacterium TMED53]|nr:MAG: hypothetical protein CBC13_08475 [Planctomycetia bacterium TMED53]